MRVAVLGLLDRQKQDLRAKVRNLDVEVEFIAAEKEPIRPSAKIDHVVVTKFTNHKHELTAVKVLGRDRVHYVGGGLGAVTRRIMELVS